MTSDEYVDLVSRHYPNRHYTEALGAGWNVVDLVKKMAEDLFVDVDMYSPLAIETRKQLRSLAETGIHCFSVREDTP